MLRPLSQMQCQRKGPLRRRTQAMQLVSSQAAELGVLLKYPSPDLSNECHIRLSRYFKLELVA